MKRQSTKLVINAGAMFGRTIGAVVLALFTTRLVVSELGEIDYGLFAMVGVTVGFSAILSDSLQAAGQRHLSHELGSSGESTITATFNTLLGLYTGVALLIVALGAIAAWPLSQALNIPDDRVAAVGWTIALTGVTLALQTARGPYLSLQFAYQRHFVVAGIESVMSALRLLAAIMLPLVPGDPLIAWAGLLACVAGLAFVAMAVASRSIGAARVDPKSFDRGRVRELLNFGGWTMLGSISWKIRLMLSQVVVLQFFTPETNGTLALSRQIAVYQTTLAQPINKAFAPAISFHHGGERSGMVQRLVSASMRYDVFIAGVIAIPLIIDPYPVFELWLGVEQAAGFPLLAEFTRFLAISILMSVVGRAANDSVAATGKIAALMMTRVSVDIAALVAAIVHIAVFDGSAIVLAYWSIASTTIVSGVNLTFMHRQAGIDAFVLIRDLAVRVLPVLALGFAAASAVVSAMDPLMVRPFVAGAASAAVMVIPAWLFLFRREERERIVGLIGSVRRRVLGGKPAGGPARDAGHAAPPRIDEEER